MNKGQMVVRGEDIFKDKLVEFKVDMVVWRWLIPRLAEY
jgi:hypothetical protein